MNTSQIFPDYEVYTYEVTTTLSILKYLHNVRSHLRRACEALRYMLRPMRACIGPSSDAAAREARGLMRNRWFGNEIISQ